MRASGVTDAVQKAAAVATPHGTVPVDKEVRGPNSSPCGSAQGSGTMEAYGALGR